MGHALSEALRVLRPLEPPATPAGPWPHALLDIRPDARVEPAVYIEVGDGQTIELGPLPEIDGTRHYHRQAARLMARALERDWVTLLATRTFDWIDDYDNPDDLADDVLDNWQHREITEDLALSLAHAWARAPRGSRVRVRQPITMLALHAGPAWAGSITASR